ncbi:MAG: acyl carrier protein [Gemmatimonadota bacterium]
MNLDQVIASTRTFVFENYLYARPDYVLGPDDLLLEHGVIDSMGVVELVDFVRASFGVDVQDEDITEDNFGTLASIARYVLGSPVSTNDRHAA